MLKPENTVLVLVDIQEKLFPVMHEKEALLEQLVRLTRGALALDLPLIRAEQYPERIGPTVPELEGLLAGGRAYPKRSFSCAGCPDFADALLKTGRTQVLVAGIETHVCVYQTAMDLVGQGMEVQVVADAVSSRTRFNRDIGLKRCEASGATLTSVETALFELLRKAEGTQFKEILNIVK